MNLCLDTDTLIDVVNGQPHVRRQFDAALQRGDQIFVSSISAHEIIFGALISKRPDDEFGAAREVLDQLVVAAFSGADAEAAARLRAELRRIGQPIGTFDTLIAGQSRHHGWTMVTANVREFGRVQGLSVVNWRAAPETP